MPRQCAHVTCKNKLLKGNGLTFHKFPNEVGKENLKRQWVTQMDRHDDWEPQAWDVVCSAHFLPEDFDTTGQTTRLREGVVPSQFKSPDDFQKAKSRKRLSTCNSVQSENKKRSRSSSSGQSQSKRKKIKEEKLEVIPDLWPYDVQLGNRIQDRSSVAETSKHHINPKTVTLLQGDSSSEEEAQTTDDDDDDPVEITLMVNPGGIIPRGMEVDGSRLTKEGESSEEEDLEEKKALSTKTINPEENTKRLERIQSEQSERKAESSEEISEEVGMEVDSEEERAMWDLSDLEEVFKLLEKLTNKVQNCDPLKIRSVKIIKGVNKCLDPLREMLSNLQKQAIRREGSPKERNSCSSAVSVSPTVLPENKQSHLSPSPALSSWNNTNTTSIQAFPISNEMAKHLFQSSATSPQKTKTTNVQAFPISHEKATDCLSHSPAVSPQKTTKTSTFQAFPISREVAERLIQSSAASSQKTTKTTTIQASQTLHEEAADLLSQSFGASQKTIQASKPSHKGITESPPEISLSSEESHEKNTSVKSVSELPNWMW